MHVRACVADGVFAPAAAEEACDTPATFLPARPITPADLTPSGWQKGTGTVSWRKRSQSLPRPGPIRKILMHLGEPLEPRPISPARWPPTDWGEFVKVHDDQDVFQGQIDELPAVDIHSL